MNEGLTLLIAISETRDLPDCMFHVYTIENLCFLGWNLTNSIMNGVEVPVFVKVRLLQGYVLFYPCA
jgi:hypothetical protein